jgi:hypothetical protein
MWVPELKVFGDFVEWVIKARGHPNITARHRTTFMFTKDREVGPRGDCVIGVGAEKATADLDSDLKLALRSRRRILITLSARGLSEQIVAQGHPNLPLDHPSDLVVRKSGFICGRTLALLADKTAADFSREFAEALSDPSTVVEMRIKVFL